MTLDVRCIVMWSLGLWWVWGMSMMPVAWGQAPTTRPGKRATTQPGTRPGKRATTQPGTRPWEQIQRQIVDKQYTQAIQMLQKLKGSTVLAEDQRLFWLGRAQFLAKQYKASVATMLSLVQEFPKSVLRHKAELGAADALAQARDFRGAQLIYAKQLKRMLSPERRLQIAQVYLRYADRYFQKAGDPSQSTHKKQNYRKAIKMYKHALELDLPETQHRQVLLRVGQAYMRINQTWYALRTFEQAANKYKTGKYADAFAFYRAKTKLRYGKRRSARRLLMDLLKDFPKSELLPQAIHLIARTYGLPNRVKKQYLALGIAVLKKLIKTFPEHPKARQAAFDIARTYYNNGRYDDAIRAFQDFVKRYAKPTKSGSTKPAKDGRAKSEQKDSKRLLVQARYQIGLCYLQQKRFEQAVDAFQTFLSAHPTDRLWPVVQRRIVTARYQQAVEMFVRKRWEAAQKYYQQFLIRYPLDHRNAQIMFRLGEIPYQQKKYTEAIEAWQRLVSKYPYSSHGRLARLRIAQTYETKLNQLEKALEAYKKITYYRYRNQAKAAIRRLTSKGLRLLTPRVFGVQEGATLEATVRNIKSLKVRLYRVDAETYFRKMYRFAGMETLDIQLIRPDREWTVKVPKYQKLHQHKVKISVGRKKPMVAVVQVSGGKLEATTVAVVSDLQIITKANRHAVFVFALNSQTRKPVAGAEILVSDGHKLLFEGKTGKDGAYQIRSEKLREVSKIHVLAQYKGSVAASGSSLVGIGYSTGVQPAGVIYTDRPAYRPGEVVQIRGILREVKDGHFQLPTQTYHLEVLTPSSRVLLRKQVKPGSFGTIKLTYRSDSASPLGRYRIKVYRKDGPSFWGGFRVAQYQLPKYQLSVKLPRRVYMYRQEIAGTIIARYGFGAPAAGKAISYRLGPLRGKGVTDAKGQLTFRLSTRELDLDRAYTLRVMMPGERAQTEAKIWMRTTAFDLGLSTVRSVYAAGEKFEVAIKASDPLGQPQSAEVRLRVLRRVQVWGRWVEREVETRVVPIGASGKASTSIQIKQGGSYVLRAKTRDASKQPIVASRYIFISGEDDKTVLRLLSDRDQFKVGETTQVQLLARRAGTALITYEADAVLHYELVPALQKGATSIPLTFTEALSPNFALSVTLLHEQKLHVVQKEFVVHRKLQISIRPTAKVWQPGQQAEVLVETRDQSGKPVAAEFSLAVVDKALLSVYPDKTPKLGKVFYRYRRKLKMVTYSSHTYRHLASTKKALTIVTTPPSVSTVAKPRHAYGRGNRWSRWRQRRRHVRITRNQIQIRQSQGQRPQEPSQEQSISGGNANVASGELSNLDGLQISPRAYLRALRTRFATTAYWNASVVTDRKGRAVIKFRLPENMTTWRIQARGVAHPTLVGEAKTSIVTRKSFFAELRVPHVASEGDRFKPRVVFHNQTDDALQVTVTLQEKSSGQKSTKKLSVPAKQSLETALASFSTQGLGGKSVTLELGAFAKAGKQTLLDRVRQQIKVRMPGVKLQAGAAGLVGERVSETLRLPGAGPFRDTRLTVQVGPVSPEWILQMAQQSMASRWSLPGITAHRASLTLTALAYLKHLGQSDSVSARMLREQLRRQVRSLRMLRRYKGAWNFIGTGDDPVFSADVFQILVRAKRDWGVMVRPIELAVVRSVIKQQYHRAYRDEVKAILLAALVQQPKSETRELFSYANRLFRQRSKLSLEGLCHVGEILLTLNRKELAQELIPYLESGWLQASQYTWREETRGIWQVPGDAQAACAIDLLAQLAPTSAATKKGIEWLLQQRRGLRWSSLLMTRRAVKALAAYYRKSRLDKVNLKLSVYVNGKKQSTLHLTGKTPGKTITVSGVGNTAKVTIVPQGSGQIRYTATLRGYSTKPPTTKARFHQIKRYYLPAYRTVGQNTIRPGFSVLRGRYTKWRNTVKRLAVGQYTRVELKVALRSYHRANDNIVVEEALPAGTMVLPSSIYVSSGTYRLEDGKIRFFLYHNRRSWVIRYRLYGTTVGRYHIPPTYAWSFARPQRFSLGQKHVLTVVDSATQTERYRLTPNELFYLGQAYVKQGKLTVVRRLLETLLTQYTLRYSYLGKVAHMLFQISLKQGPHAAVVKYFELLKEHSPDTILPFQQIVRVGEAYAAANEHERAYMVYQATTAARFLKELNVAQVLETEGEFGAAVAFIERLTLQYPDLRSVQESVYALAQSVFQFADKCQEEPAKRKKWLHKAEQLFARYVLLYPENPSADRASYTRANVMLALEQKEEAIRYLRELATRYPKSGYLADIHYLEAYSLYLQRKSDRALTLLRRVSNERYPDGEGGQARSKNRYLASYLIAQIFHANDKLQQALTWYKRVQKRFVDAATQVKYFQRVFLKIPEVRTIAPKDKASVRVQHQNIKDLTVLVYYVDLMKLYLLKKNLNAVTRINLAGIRPSHREQRTLSKQREFGPKRSTLTLPLQRRGSYLVVLKSRQKEVSGIVLRTALTLEVQQDKQTGRVVVHLFERGTRKPVPHALIRVVGSADKQFRSGKTDLRGIFTATNVRGTATVIAQKSDDFVFFRGKQYLQPARYRKKTRYNFDSTTIQGELRAPSTDMMMNIRSGNYKLQQSGRKQLEQLYQKSKRGVQLKYLK